MPNYWLLKTEPGSYSFADLERDGVTVWDGVRNNVALKHMRSMQAGDLALIYHTGTERQVVGIAELTSAPYPDPQADLTDNRPGAVPVVVDVRLVRCLVRPVSLSAIKAARLFLGISRWCARAVSRWCRSMPRSGRGCCNWRARHDQVFRCLESHLTHNLAICGIVSVTSQLQVYEATAVAVRCYCGISDDSGCRR